MDSSIQLRRSFPRSAKRTYIHTYVFNCRDFYNTPVGLSFLLHHNMIGERIVFNTLFNAGAINAKVDCNLLLEAFA